MFEKLHDFLEGIKDENKRRLVRYILNSINESKFFKGIRFIGVESNSELALKFDMYDNNLALATLFVDGNYYHKNCVVLSQNSSEPRFEMLFENDSNILKIQYGKDVVVFNEKYITTKNGYNTVWFTISVYLDNMINGRFEDDPDYKIMYKYSKFNNESFVIDDDNYFDGYEKIDEKKLRNFDDRIILGNKFCQYCHDNYVDWFDAQKKGKK